MLKFKFLFLTLFFSFTLNSLAQTFKAETDKQAISVGENFSVVFSLASQGDNFKPPSFADFKVISGPSKSQSYSWINGKSSAKTSYTYILQGTKEGVFTINPAYIDIDGKVFASNSLQIRVSGLSASVTFDNNTPKSAKNELEKNIYIKTALSKKKVYQGEQFVAFYRIYSSPNAQFEVVDQPKLPTFNSFWAQDINKNAQIVFTYEFINGYNYRRADFKKTILIPQATGNLSLEPIEMNINARLKVKMKNKNRRSVFDDPFFDAETFQDYNYILKSEPINIEVAPLPDGKPNSFIDAIGEFSVKFSIDKNEVKLGEPITLKLEIDGNGNFPLITAPKIENIEGFDVFAPKQSDDYSATESGFQGKKTFEYILMPKSIGALQIPTFEFSYLNAKSGVYLTQKSDKYSVKVVKNESLSIDFSSDASNSQSFANKVLLFVILPGVLIISFMLAYVFWKKRNKTIEPEREFVQEPIQKNENNKANFEDYLHSKKDNFKYAKKMALSGSAQECALALSNAIWTNISNLLGMGLSELTREKIKEEFKLKNIESDLIENLIKALDIIEHIRYSPVSVEKVNLIELVDECEILMKDIEKSI